jgi:formylglycine-generating enzyme required for sulfatase activity
MFCIHETRYKDYAEYAAEIGNVGKIWKRQLVDGYSSTENNEEHPVTRVTWEDARAFCAWLSKKEGRTYRLPTDREWSCAVGVGRDEKWKQDSTPATIIKDTIEFPWGTKWPPPKGAGNYSDQSRKEKAPRDDAQYLDGYDDGFPTTAPVMGYAPNKLGLYDLGGNVWEWCEDQYNAAKADRVLRGGSWNSVNRDSLLSSSRNPRSPSIPNYIYNSTYGFRVVIELP